MKIHKLISTNLLYLIALSVSTSTTANATIVRNAAGPVRSLIALFNKGVPTVNNITKTSLGNDFNHVNVRSSISRFNSHNINHTAPTKIPLRNTFENVNVKSSVRSLSSLSNNSTSSNSTENIPNVNVSSMVSQFETSIKNSNQPTFEPTSKKYSTSEVYKLSDEVLDRNGFLDGFNKTTKPLPKLESPLLNENLDNNLKIIRERKAYLNSFLVGSMASRGVIFEKDTSQKQQQKNLYSNVSPFIKSLLISKGMISEKDNNQ